MTKLPSNYLARPIFKTRKKNKATQENLAKQKPTQENLTKQNPRQENLTKQKQQQQ